MDAWVESELVEFFMFIAVGGLQVSSMRVSGPTAGGAGGGGL